ncbi:methyltransferase domain-containing protein [Sphingomonas sp. G124]|uniref:Methyltransferase domain-containing protein n=1 Tax=Sphingomonas cremea TaxID=2904799 RepID=A0A9X1QLX1_9SPHN|nr:methyltransferase domain-containing protein [Sphingomonas cremea]MCF2514323.1 methyltransferase domain-containing protein [Sphingomonas cremea]
MSAYYEQNYRSFLPVDRQAAILDIGCGRGDFVRYLHSLGYRNITAVDMDEDVIATLQGFEGVTARRQEITDQLPAQLSGPWDLIVIRQMIYYLDRRQAPVFVRSLAGSLNADGRVIVEIFNGALLSSRFTELKDPAILTAYTELGLRRLLEWNGLSVERLVGAQSGGSWLYRLLQWLEFRIYRLLLMLERGRDDELPSIGRKSIIAVARRG